MPYITSGEAARILGISKRTLFRWEEEGKIKSKRDGILKARVYDKEYIAQTYEILKLDKLEKEHLAKLPEIREKVREHLFVTDVEEIRKGKSAKLMDVPKAKEAFDAEEEWMKEHKRILSELSKYPRNRLRELLLDES